MACGVDLFFEWWGNEIVIVYVFLLKNLEQLFLVGNENSMQRSFGLVGIRVS